MSTVFDVVETMQNCGYTNNNIQAAGHFLIMHEDSFYEENYDEIISTLIRLKESYIDDHIAARYPGKTGGSLTDEERIKLWYNPGDFGRDERKAMITEYTRLFDMVRECTISEEDFDFDVVQTIQPTGEIVWTYVGDEEILSISFYTEHGETPEPIKMPDNWIVNAFMLPELEADGYTFTGWRDQLGNGTVINIDYSDVGVVPVLFAGWKEASEEPEEPIDSVSTGRKHLLYQMFPPVIARVLSE